MFKQRMKKPRRQVGTEEVEDHFVPIERCRWLIGNRRELRDLRLVEFLLCNDEFRDARPPRSSKKQKEKHNLPLHVPKETTTLFSTTV